ncbi:MAG: hypothetical protein AAGJ46_14420 [Planctomycetota bacterium]
MPSYLDNLMARRGAPTLRRAMGTPNAITLRPPGGEPLVCDAIVGQLTSVPVDDAGEEAIETVVVHVESTLLKNFRLPLTSQTAVSVAKYGDREFTVDEQQSRYGGALATIGLERQPLREFQQGRQSGTQ